jgi:hypothetical protein
MSNVRLARVAFALLAWVFVALTVVQVYLAGTAVAQLGGTNDFGTHQAVGFVILLVALVQLVLAFASKLGLRMTGGSALLLLMMIAQSALVHLNSTSLAALHPLNGFLVAVLGLFIAWRALGYIRAPLPVEPERVPAAAAPVASSAAPPETVENRDDETNP